MRVTVARLASAAVAVTLAASVSARAQTLTFLEKWPEPEYAPYFEKLVKDYQAAHPGVSINLQAVGDEPYKDKIRVVMSSNEVPDIFFSWSGPFGWKFAKAGRAEDLTQPVLQTDFKDRFAPSLLSPFAWNGKQWGVPLNLDIKLMVYNKALFQKVGIEVPKTFEELLADCAKLKAAGITPIAFGDQFPWAAAHYVGDLNAKRVPPTTRRADYDLATSADKLFTDPGYVDALKDFSTLVSSGYFNKGSNALEHEAARGAFTAGRTAMMYLEIVELPGTGGVDPGKLDRDGWGFFAMPPIPNGRGDQTLLTGAPDGFMVSSASKNQKLALDFLRFMTSPAEAAAYTKMTGMPSAVKGVITADNASPTMLQAVQTADQAPGLALWMDTDMDARVAETYLAGMQAIVGQTQTPEQVMQKVRDVALQVQKQG